MLPGTGRALNQAATLVVLIIAALIPTDTHPTPAAPTAWVIWDEGPSTSGRGPDQEH